MNERCTCLSTYVPRGKSEQSEKKEERVSNSACMQQKLLGIEYGPWEVVDYEHGKEAFIKLKLESRQKASYVDLCRPD